MDTVFKQLLWKLAELQQLPLASLPFFSKGDQSFWAMVGPWHLELKFLPRSALINVASADFDMTWKGGLDLPLLS